MKSMEVYSALFAMVIHSEADSNESSFSTDIWEFEKSAECRSILGAIYLNNNVTTCICIMTHGDIELDLDYGDDEIRRAQNEIKSERVDEYAFPSICSLDLDSPV